MFSLVSLLYLYNSNVHFRQKKKKKKKIRRAESFRTISFKYEMVISGNILEALENGLPSGGLIHWIYSTFPNSILMI
jgi:hypothetical protein